MTVFFYSVCITALKLSMLLVSHTQPCNKIID